MSSDSFISGLNSLSDALEHPTDSLMSALFGLGAGAVTDDWESESVVTTPMRPPMRRVRSTPRAETPRSQPLPLPALPPIAQQAPQRGPHSPNWGTTPSYAPTPPTTARLEPSPPEASDQPARWWKLIPVVLLAAAGAATGAYVWLAHLDTSHAELAQQVPIVVVEPSAAKTQEPKISFASVKVAAPTSHRMEPRHKRARKSTKPTVRRRAPRADVDDILAAAVMGAEPSRPAAERTASAAERRPAARRTAAAEREPPVAKRRPLATKASGDPVVDEDEKADTDLMALHVY